MIKLITKNKVLVLSSMLLIAGCSSKTKNKSSLSELYEAYLQYKNTINKNNIVELASDFFSKNMLHSTTPNAFDELLFKKYISTKDSHFERISLHESCLTINGFDEENEPVVISLKYTSNKGWLIDEVHITYFDSKSDFAKSAKCPSDFPSAF